MSSGYDRIYLDLLPRLAQCDLAESARRLGLEVRANGDVAANFCGREFRITHAGVDPTDGLPVDVNYRSVLAHYILSRGRGEPAHSFLPLGRLTGMIDGQKTHAQGLFVRPLIREFGADYDKFEAAARKLGGTPERAPADRGQVWNFPALPKIPVRLVFYHADEEFPADIQLMFDRTAPRFMEFECLAFLSGCFTKGVTAGRRRGKSGSRCCPDVVCGLSCFCLRERAGAYFGDSSGVPIIPAFGMRGCLYSRFTPAE